jgi:hypothetical protein
LQEKAEEKCELNKSDEGWTDSLRKTASWTFIIFSSLMTLIIAFLLIKGASKFPDFFVIAIRHFPTVVGLPLAAVASLFIVISLKIVSGDKLNFKIFGLQFEGVSGPVILWVLCFLAMTLAINTTWDKTCNEPLSFRKIIESGDLQP